jgi:hypothetical protein
MQNRLSNATEMMRVRKRTVEHRNPAQAEAEVAVLNLEHVAEAGTLGDGWIRSLDVFT